MASYSNSKNDKNKKMMKVGSTTNLLFKKLLAKEGGHILKKTCPNHPKVHLIQFGNRKPFCPIEHDKAVNRKSNLESTKFYYDQKKLHKKHRIVATKNFLYNHSILFDNTIKKASFDNFRVKMKGEKQLQLCKQKAILQAKMFCQPYLPFSSILAGPVGRGKSHLAMSILKYVNKNAPKKKNGENVTCMFVDVNELMRKIRASYDSENGSIEEKLIHMMTNVYLLVLDDIGSEINKKSENGVLTHSQAILGEILSGRQNKRNIITTNDNINQIQKTYNSRVISRMLSGTNGHIISFSSKIPDMRVYRSNK